MDRATPISSCEGNTPLPVLPAKLAEQFPPKAHSSAFLFKASTVVSAISTVVFLQLVRPIPSPEVEAQRPSVTLLPVGSVSSMPPPTPIASLHSAPVESPDDQGTPEAQETSATESQNAESSTPEETAIDVHPLRQRGVYLTATSIAREKFFNDIVSDLEKSGGSTIVFDVKGSAVFFHSAAPMATEIGLVKSIYELPAVLRLLKEKGIYTIGRFVAVKDAGLTTRRPELRIKHPTSGRALSHEWIDPADDTAIAYNMEVICELAQAGIDEVNLDYIRFSTADFGALRAYSGTEKADRVEKFIRAARETIDRCGPATKLGLSTYAILGWKYDINLETLGQDVVRFAPLVDIISPMAYPATFAEGHYYRPGVDPRSRMYFLVYRTLTGYKDLLGAEHGHKIRPWIQGYGVSARDMTEQIEAVYDAGSCGFTVWNANNNYAPTFAAMSKDTQQPERCKAGISDVAVAGS